MPQHLVTRAEWESLTPASQQAIARLQARLTLAANLIAALTFGGTLSPNMMTPDQKRAWEAWQEEMK